ncbi:hypothetical protein M0R45_021920 [Rubus argutus]|uniref:GDT1 family protein n=1 Tax=Rubus argutus TaxID=59490 RepID=A0AAW1XD31_RUBAR
MSTVVQVISDALSVRFHQVTCDDCALRDRRQDLLRRRDPCDAPSQETRFVRLPRTLIVMTILSVLVGWAAPNLLSRTWTHHITTVLFFAFGLWSLWDALKETGNLLSDLTLGCHQDADLKAKAGATKQSSKDDDELKKQNRSFLLQLFSPIFLKAFSITFFGEWGDKSQLATIGLAADENPLGVVIGGGIIGQALCTTAAVLGGKSLASQISEKIHRSFEA